MSALRMETECSIHSMPYYENLRQKTYSSLEFYVSVALQARVRMPWSLRSAALAKMAAMAVRISSAGS